MRTETRYFCDICGYYYDTADQALKCEARGRGVEFPIGMIFGDNTPGDIYSKCVFAVAVNSIHGHWNDISLWATRDNGVGDNFETLCGGGNLVYTTPERLRHENKVDQNSPMFKRMIEGLKKKGLDITIWDGEKAVPYIEESPGV